MNESDIEVYNLAKELDVLTRTVVEVAKSLGITVKGHTSRVSSEEAKKIRSKIKMSEEIKEEAQVFSSESGKPLVVRRESSLLIRKKKKVKESEPEESHVQKNEEIKEAVSRSSVEPSPSLQVREKKEEVNSSTELNIKAYELAETLKVLSKEVIEAAKSIGISVKAYRSADSLFSSEDAGRIKDKINEIKASKVHKHSQRLENQLKEYLEYDDADKADKGKCRLGIIDFHVDLYKAFKDGIIYSEKIDPSSKEFINRKSEWDVINILDSDNIVPKEEIDTLDEYRKLRNEAGIYEREGHKLTWDEVVDYAFTGYRIFLYLAAQEIASTNLEESYAFITKAMGLAPDKYLDTHRAWGEFFYENKQVNLALPIFRFIFKKDPNYEHIHNWLGKTLYYLKKYPEALEEIKKFIKQNTSNYLVWQFAGVIYLHMKKMNGARHFFYKAIKLNDQDPDNFFGLGYTFYCLKKMSSAQYYLEKAVNLELKDSPSKNWIHYFLGLIYLEKAISQFKECKKGGLLSDSLVEVVENIVKENKKIKKEIDLFPGNKEPDTN